ncbi:MAG: acyltransferase [Butyrivibrio sp.]|nr:acyltransferase [Butyrivibrio sp.]
MNNKICSVLLRICGIKLGKAVKIHGWPYIFRFRGAKIEIGDRVVINSSFLSNLIGLYQPTIIVARYGGKISIGDDVGISGSTIYSWDDIDIGARTQIGANTKIVDTDFHSLDYRKRKSSDSVKTKPVHIGSDVFIGMNSIILKGTSIGNGCVVGAGSVVSGEFPDGVLIAGNPARVVRHIDDERK